MSRDPIHTGMTVQEVDDFLEAAAERHGFDWQINITMAHQCGFDAALRITLKPNSLGADRSVVFYKTSETLINLLLTLVNTAMRDPETRHLFTGARPFRLEGVSLL